MGRSSFTNSGRDGGAGSLPSRNISAFLSTEIGEAVYDELSVGADSPSPRRVRADGAAESEALEVRVGQAYGRRVGVFRSLHIQMRVSLYVDIQLSSHL